MSKESTTPDLVKLARRLTETADRRDFDAARASAEQLAESRAQADV
jgi:ribosomal protein L18E